LPVLTNGQVQFQLQGETGVTYTIEGSTDLQNWMPLATNVWSSPGLISVPDSPSFSFWRAKRGLLPVFTGAVTVQDAINFNGYQLFADSYDSYDPNHSTPTGVYDPLTRKAGGDINTQLGLINVSGAFINGRIRSTPSGSLSLGPAGWVGDLDWLGPGVQPGWFDPGFRFCYRTFDFSGFSNGITPSVMGTNTYILGSDNYVLPSLTLVSNQTVTVIGNATLYVAGDIDMKGNSSFFIHPGAALHLIVAGAKTVLRGVNTVGSPVTFQYYGLPANTSFQWSGNQGYMGLIFAPQAAVSIGGGGAGTNDYQGAIVAKSLSLNGRLSIHFDENLLRRGLMR
jgi:hypothetical protein